MKIYRNQSLGISSFTGRIGNTLATFVTYVVRKLLNCSTFALNLFKNIM